MTYYSVIDTNVLVSASLKWNSVPSIIMELAFSGIITPLISEAILSEYREVLLRPKFHLTNDIVNDILDEFLIKSVFISDAQHYDIALPDPKDLKFLEVAMEARKTEPAYLITGNLKHFPKETYIVSPRQMLDIIFDNSNTII